MWIERQTFSIIEEHYSEVTFENITCQVSSIKIDALMNSVHSTFHGADLRDSLAFLSSEILSMRFCKSAERVWNTLVLK
jgi:hypothetical protein